MEPVFPSITLVLQEVLDLAEHRALVAATATAVVQDGTAVRAVEIAVVAVAEAATQYHRQRKLFIPKVFAPVMVR